MHPTAKQYVSIVELDTEGEMIFLKITVYWFGVNSLLFGGLCATAWRAARSGKIC
jgi:hypothetical protein